MKFVENIPTLKEDSYYYYQLQGQLHITEREICYFFIYTSKWTHFIKYNKSFWNSKMESCLKL